MTGRRGKPLEPGDKRGHTLIVELRQKGPTSYDWRYLVRCMHCGEHQILSHKSLNERERNSVRRCFSCRINAGSKPTPIEPPKPTGVRDNRGCWWPWLGAMGPRWGNG